MAGTTPRKSTPRKAATTTKAAVSKLDDLSRLPEVTLDLDALDKASVVKDAVLVPFTFRHNGHIYTMIDPRDMDWRELLQGMRNPALFMSSAMQGKDKDKFLNTPVPGWKLNAIFENWQTHFGVEGLGNLSALLGS